MRNLQGFHRAQPVGTVLEAAELEGLPGRMWVSQEGLGVSQEGCGSLGRDGCLPGGMWELPAGAWGLLGGTWVFLKGCGFSRVGRGSPERDVGLLGGMWELPDGMWGPSGGMHTEMHEGPER